MRKKNRTANLNRKRSSAETNVDDVRASRDGHEFHEAWTARKALQLIFPRDGLVGIAVEGLHPADQRTAVAEAVEIADLVLYYGKKAIFTQADSVNFLQFKYSISRSNSPFLMSDAKKTVKKFALTYLDFKKRYGQREADAKLRFDLVTNRPVNTEFQRAVQCILKNEPCENKKVKAQANQFIAATGLKGRDLRVFASKFKVIGYAGSVSFNKNDLYRTLVDWSTAPMAQSRLGAIRELVRDKAGFSGKTNNVIYRTDVFHALGVQDEEDLLPCKESFPQVGPVVEREQLNEVINLIESAERPVLIHAAGGAGKTVFLQSLASIFSANDEVILFDCFGSGVYRSPDDARHLPKRGLIHIVNLLACKGLCDPLLPQISDVEQLLISFRGRIEQAVKTLQRVSSQKQIVLMIDAIDNAAEHAKDKGDDPFPRLLLESIERRGRIHGLKIVASCRSHRREIAKGDVQCLEFQLKAFTRLETEKYLRKRLKRVNEVEIQVAQARSGGNPRVLAHLVEGGRGVLDKSEIQNKIELPDLLQARIQGALSEAIKRGYKTQDLDAFLAGLAVLPPPVPLEDYASAHKMDISAMESFAADLAPLLERTRYGLMFRDEPTETLIRDKYASKESSLRQVARNLSGRQSHSLYAAKALPGLLQRLNDGGGLFNLAFDESYPNSVTSMTGKRNIRYARLKAAVAYTARKKDYNKLLRLMVEISTLAAVDRRGTDYILDYPDMATAANDLDALRRLFESRTEWPGKKHARMAIAHILSGEVEDAYRHIVHLREWISHYFRQDPRKHDQRDARPVELDCAVIPLCLISQDRIDEAIQEVRTWKDWYGFQLGGQLFRLLNFTPRRHVFRFLSSLTRETGIIAAALSFFEMDVKQRRLLVKKLAKTCRMAPPTFPKDDFHQKNGYIFEDGLLRASAIALSMDLKKEARVFTSCVSLARPGIWSFRDYFLDKYIAPFILKTALIRAESGKPLLEQDLYPREIYEFVAGLKGSDAQVRSAILKKMEEKVHSENALSRQKGYRPSFSHEQKQEAEQFFQIQLNPLIALTNSLIDVLKSPIKRADKNFLVYISTWKKGCEAFSYRDQQRRCFDALGLQLALFILHSRSDLKMVSIEKILSTLDAQAILSPWTLIEVVQILSQRPPFLALAGQLAVKSKLKIEKEDDVNSRASLYGALARAIAPASRDEAVAYFKIGLEQMDAIGSGDYRFTNDLLLFAAECRGKELTEKDFHTLTNICELNMPYEESKFPWIAFGKAFSKVAGYRCLPKLSRWDDRSKISVHYTLLPYLVPLIADDKIDADLALPLLRLSDTAEWWDCNSAHLAEILHSKPVKNEKLLLRELIKQFFENNPGIPYDGTVKTLANLAKEVLGASSSHHLFLSSGFKRFGQVRHEGNENRNYRGESVRNSSNNNGHEESEESVKARILAAKTLPIDVGAMTSAVEQFNKLRFAHAFRDKFFSTLRSKVTFADRALYIDVIANLPNENLYQKITELGNCRKMWAKSSVSLDDKFERLALPLLRKHLEEFVHDDYLSGSLLNDLSQLCSVSVSVLTLELIQIYALERSTLPPSVWIAMACHISEKTEAGVAQQALTRLLNCFECY
jgi:hypothetical protein